jgi:hypothetical protein
MKTIDYNTIKARADRITQMRNDRLRKMCKDAGLSPDLLGIHPHNAMCDYPNNPWPEVNYTICKKLDWLQRTGWEFQASRIVSKLYAEGRTNLN